MAFRAGRSRRGRPARRLSIYRNHRHIRAMQERTTHRSLVFTGLILAMFMSAIEGTIVATAMPSIAAELGGFELYGREPTLGPIGN